MQNSQQQAVLFLSSHSAYDGSNAIACLEALMTTAVFDVPAKIVLHGEGVMQLLKDQNGDVINMKTLSKMYGALSLYGITSIYVLEDSLQDLGLQVKDLLSPEDLASDAEPIQISIIKSSAFAAMLQQSKAVFNF